jgi:hypothetical protein
MDRYDPRWSDDDSRAPERDGADLSRGARASPDARELTHPDPRDVFVRDLDLPREETRERVFVRERECVDLRGSESRMLATVGAFRVGPAHELRDVFDRPADPRSTDLRHLREAGLVRTVPQAGRGTAVVTLTDRGRDVLERHRSERHHSERHDDARQAFHAGLRKPRELTHDSQVYRAYLRDAERLHEQGMDIRRVILDYELKREYQQFLQERNRGRSDSDGRPDRSPAEIQEWAAQRNLPCNDGHVQFPDARIEYRDVDGHTRWHDIEVTTEHYRGALGASKASSGFSCYRGSGARISAGRGGGRGGRGIDPRLAEEVLR